ncbi:Hypothetical protein SRAE_0000054100 [Strongyloides ratti]|uniref:Uncharacterized protein n=1 Tax=Strongyloides ratti TaxID=34506 RepID=A0A090KZV9_STRRB|nr:Hypothetical protein SRAE_0000054100 [Strongyloides ratti]CEF61417.1 Hypothetical protein SRAE_0000054100 [Strongyloides ratti]
MQKTFLLDGIENDKMKKAIMVIKSTDEVKEYISGQPDDIRHETVIEKIKYGETILLPIFLEAEEKICKVFGFLNKRANVSMVSGKVVEMLKLPTNKKQQIQVTLANVEITQLQETLKINAKFKINVNTDVCKEVFMAVNDASKKYHMTVGSDILQSVEAIIEFQAKKIITNAH